MSQMKLSGKTEKQEKKTEKLEKSLADMRAKYKAIPEWREDEVAMAEFQLGIERYGGRRVPWYLHPELTEWSGVTICDKTFSFYEKPPSIENYTIITYWAAYTSDEDFNEVKEKSETKEFIKDRLDWAEMQYLKMISAVKEAIEENNTSKAEWDVV